jgi:hypothetical protein
VTGTTVPVPTVAGQNTLTKPPRITGNAQGDALTLMRWLSTFWDIWTTTGQIQGSLLNHDARITNLEAAEGSGVTSFNMRLGAVVLTSGDVVSALGFTPANAAASVSSFNTRTGPVLLTTGDVTAVYTPPTATGSVLGISKPDGVTITVAAGVYTAAAYTLPIATGSVLGGIKPDGTSITVNASTGVASATGGGSGTDLYDWSAGFPALGSFTQVNISGAGSVVTNGTKSIALLDSGAGTSDPRGLYIAVPGSTPYRVAVCLQPSLRSINYANIQAGWTDGTKLEVLAVYSTVGVYYQKQAAFTGPNTNSNIQALPSDLHAPIWFGLHDDGTNVYWEISWDGANYFPLYSVAKSAGYLGSSGYSNIFFGISQGGSNTPCALSLRCYDVNGLSRVVG